MRAGRLYPDGVRTSLTFAFSFGEIVTVAINVTAMSRHVPRIELNRALHGGESLLGKQFVSQRNIRCRHEHNGDDPKPQE